MAVKWNEWNERKNNFNKYKDIKSNLIYGKLSKKVPEVSIMIITYRRADKLKIALDSAINQNYTKNYEIVVCDDSGYDRETDLLMKDYCKKYKNIIYYRHEKNLGQYANWNRACELCRTNWYCLLHDDDMLKDNYLDRLMNSVDDNVGLIGSYMDTIDNRNITKKRFIDSLIDLFIKIRNKKTIKLTINDNINHIFVLSCCLFINKNKAINIGGLDDKYFPSSDFVFASKMNYYYSTKFLPEKLSFRGIGDNESLKQSVCDDSVKCAYQLTKSICKTLNYSDKKAKRKASIAAVISEIGVKGYNDVDYGRVKEKLGMKSIYNNSFIINLINIYSKIMWGLLLFRRGK